MQTWPLSPSAPLHSSPMRRGSRANPCRTGHQCLWLGGDHTPATPTQSPLSSTSTAKRDPTGKAAVSSDVQAPNSLEPCLPQMQEWGWGSSAPTPVPPPWPESHASPLWPQALSEHRSWLRPQYLAGPLPPWGPCKGEAGGSGCEGAESREGRQYWAASFEEGGAPAQEPRASGSWATVRTQILPWSTGPQSRFLIPGTITTSRL